ncbi:MAG: uroporphyrinogen-III synthase [Lentisphaerae bacterium]|nr:MAG: uroporphyrinogen-III synthase [Lentisphaerota bacterium]
MTPSSYTSEQLAEALEQNLTAGSRVMLWRSNLAPVQLRERLAATGCHVTDVTGYETAPATRHIDPRTIAGLDALTFTSSSTVHNFCHALPEQDRSDILTRIPAFAIGPVTAATLREYGAKHIVQATEHTVDGLIQTLIQHFSSIAG